MQEHRAPTRPQPLSLGHVPNVGVTTQFGFSTENHLNSQTNHPVAATSAAKHTITQVSSTTGNTPRNSDAGVPTNAVPNTRPASMPMCTQNKYLSLHRPCQNKSTTQNIYAGINNTIEILESENVGCLKLRKGSCGL
ncbi:hypothetical protein VFPPC_16979 [Pochonia chlamydosporia 170]|uniref:Uncharacterized protein n=1 Tax=Pochonia chlamydosporia 170 TaxID=1380566 RepID=A0A179EZ16_METCM|nr:hypothetical protein VFPPC_16979 [Pochonia chlamydosporia 170]OAQ58421.1 hypothetical protein VFPPC_16979 [Pochonia chlamydosporia 170]